MQLGVENLFYPDRRLAAFAAAEGIPALILAPRLADYVDANGVYLHGFENTLQGFGHWNRTANALAGEMIGDDLCASLGD